ncbi:HEAT repeat domain-containing protein [Planctomicrobium sp. SH527]|uniref:HEAT repeat domain-containing protein n=1 Tax=Planctomicrobium sp. SH527 TaxID=3448123 RepID=UPI003F5C5582
MAHRMFSSLAKIAGIAFGAVLFTTVADADVVRLRSGGEVRGRIIEAVSATPAGKSVKSSQPSPPTVIETRSGTKVTLEGEEIDFVARRNELSEEYVTRSRQIEQTVEAHLELAEWCRVNGLLDQRQEQLEQVLNYDPDHEEARRVLGYVRHFGRWMTKDDVMTERGYFRYQGKWVTRQELDLLEANSAKKSKEGEWKGKIRGWMAAIASGVQDRQMKAIAELQQIRDPDALNPLMQMMSQHESNDIRLLYIQILKQIDSNQAITPLVDRLLNDPSDLVRSNALRAIVPTRTRLGVPIIITGLSNRSNLVVRRAAEALGEIGDTRAVPALIEALVTTHYYNIDVPTPIGGGSGITVGRDRRPFTTNLPPEVEIAARTGQLPYGVIQNPTTPIVMQRVTVSEDLKNPTVLEALVKLTGQDLGYNERDWHVWWAIQKSP